MKSNLIDWKNVWDEFDGWFSKCKPSHCKKCGHFQEDKRDNWTIQENRIKIIINKHYKLTSSQWKFVWAQFASWFQCGLKPCSDCSNKEIPEWEDQQTKIEKLVEGELWNTLKHS